MLDIISSIVTAVAGFFQGALNLITGSITG